MEIHFHHDFLSSLPVSPWLFFPYTQLKSGLNVRFIGDGEERQRVSAPIARWHMTWRPQLIFWLLILLAPFLLWLLALLSLRRRLGELYLRHFENPRRERLFLSAVSFLIAFSAARSVAHAVHREAIGFRGVFVGTTHVHHLVFGILILLLIGYLWLAQIGTGMEKPEAIPSKSPRRLSRITAILYGVGAALTLDEFALWFNLANVYWERAGRESVDAVILFLTVSSISLWGGAFFHSLLRLVLSRRRAAAMPDQEHR